MNPLIHVGVVENDDLCTHSLISSMVGVLLFKVSLDIHAVRNKAFFLYVSYPRSKPVPVSLNRLL